MIECGEFPEEICAAVVKILDEKGDAPLSVGSLNNQQTGITCPEQLNNHIFVKNVDLKSLWQWICAAFLHYHKYGYDWFGLLRFLADKSLLDKGMETTNEDLERQMTEWYPQQNCKANNVKVYRTGYLGDTPHVSWTKEQFMTRRRSNQKEEGFDHLNKLCNTDLLLAWEANPVKMIQ